MPIDTLNKLTGKKYIKLTERGNKSILAALKLVASLGRTTLLLQDQGGWITYKQFAEKAGLDIIELKTDYGLTDLDDLRAKTNPSTVALINSMPGYHALEDMTLILEICKENAALLINDVSGSIGTPEAKLGNIIIGSFGRWKPINMEYGGFIATDDKNTFDAVEGNFDDERLDDLRQKLDELQSRLEKFKTIHQKIIQDLAEFDIIHPAKQGINVIVKFQSEAEKQKLIKYCNENNLEYTACPRYIRVNTDAVSIEVKRL